MFNISSRCQFCRINIAVIVLSSNQVSELLLLRILCMTHNTQYNTQYIVYHKSTVVSTHCECIEI